MSTLEHGAAIVTGGAGGIGRWIALGLAQAGFTVVLVGRDRVRGETVRAWVSEQATGGMAELMVTDLSSLVATQALGQKIARRHPRVSLLVNNAGVFRARRERTAEGHETVLAVNHLSPFVLTRELEGPLRAGAPSRIVTVGSSTSDGAHIDPDNLELEHHWGMVRAYSQSKLAVMMATFEWARRLDGSGVVANVVHPGTVATGLVRTPGVIGLAWRLMALWSRSEQEGAATPLHVALAPDLAGITGKYFKECGIAEPNRLARNLELVGRVWRATEDLVRQA